MKPIERTLIIVLLAVCAISLSIIAIQGISAAGAASARAEFVESIRSQSDANLAEMQLVLDAYKEAAYGDSVDRIAEQQLIATETTNLLLTKVVNQVTLLTLLMLP